MFNVGGNSSSDLKDPFWTCTSKCTTEITYPLCTVIRNLFKPKNICVFFCSDHENNICPTISSIFWNLFLIDQPFHIAMKTVFQPKCVGHGGSIPWPPFSRDFPVTVINTCQCSLNFCVTVYIPDTCERNSVPDVEFSRVSSSFKHNASFVSRLPTIRRHKSTSLHSPSLAKGIGSGSAGGGSGSGGGPRGFAELNASAENLG